MTKNRKKYGRHWKTLEGIISSYQIKSVLVCSRSRSLRSVLVHVGSAEHATSLAQRPGRSAVGPCAEGPGQAEQVMRSVVRGQRMVSVASQVLFQSLVFRTCQRS